MGKEKSVKQVRAKNWCLTINNPIEKGLHDYCMGFNGETDEYMCCAHEVGEKGTHHIQGVLISKDRLRLSSLKKRWPGGHFEKMLGTPAEAVTYCKKDGNYHEHGVLPTTTQGRRSDLESVKQLVDEGKFDLIREEHYGLFIRYRRAIVDDIDSYIVPRREPPRVYIYWGASGTGKSKACFDQCSDAYWKVKGNWWDGYRYQEDVVIDEFYGWLPIDFMLRLFDRYPLRVEVKGGFRQFVAKRIFVTSNVHWRDWWASIRPEHVAAFERRITECREFTKQDAIGINNISSYLLRSF